MDSQKAKIAVVTGSNKGIGRAIVKDLASKFDGLVYLTSRNIALGQKTLDELVQENPALTNIRHHQLDIADDQSIEAFAKFIKETHGGLDVVVNNAAIGFPEESEMPFCEKARKTLEVNFYGTLNFSKAVFPLLRQNGRVVNVASMLGLLNYIKDGELKTKLANPNLTVEDVVNVMDRYIESSKDGSYESLGFPKMYSAYSVSKIGLIALTRAQQLLFDREETSRSILINSVCPGYVKTDLNGNKGILTTEQGAITPVHLALIPADETKPRGEFWSLLQPVDWFKEELYKIV